MSINLLETLKSKVGRSLAENSAEFFDEDQTNTGNAVDGTFAAILAGLIQKVSHEKGAKSLHKVLKEEDVRDYDLEDIFTRSPQTVNGMVNRGTHFLPSVYPGRLREATNAVAEDSKIKKLTSSKMAKISAPLMLSVLGKHVQDNNLSVDGLKTLLNGQKAGVKAALSDKFFDAAELSAFGWTKKEVVKEEPKPRKVKKEKPVKVKKVAAPVVEEVIPAEVNKGGLGFLKWLLPLLLILALLLFLMRGCGGVDTGVEQRVPDHVRTTAAAPVKEVVKETAAVATSMFGKVNDAAMGLLSNIKFAAGSAGEQMMSFIKNDADSGSGEGRFRFTNLNFASGSATIAGESGAEVDNLSSILKAYEDIVVKIEGYTDSQGRAESNQILSQKRAEAVRSRLIASGIPDARISTEGFGAANPVATNDTPEGRAENRRIEIVIVK